MLFKRTSLYTALTVALMTTFLLMSFAILQYIPWDTHGEALLIRAPRLTTNTWAVFDPTTGNIRYGNHIEEPRPIASVTKLFTAYMVFHTNSSDTETTINWDDLNTDGDFGKLVYGEKLTLEQLLFPLLLESSNDAGAAITRTFGSLYPEAVQGAIDDLGLKNTSIADGTGLSVKDVSSPRDLANFFVHVRKTYPHITDITQLRMHINGKRGLVNNDPARTFPNFTGGKQGYTPEAGKTFVGTFMLPQSHGEVGIVLLGSTDLKSDIAKILASLK